MANEKRKKWLHIILWSLLDLLLIVPVLLLLWWFGQLIEEKRQQPAPSDTSAVYSEMEEMPSEMILQGDYVL